MKIRTLLSVCLIGLCQTTFAQMPPKPASCPSLSALKAQPFFMAQKPDQAPGYAAISLGKYQTNDNWAFLMAFIEADNMMEAIMTANQNLPKIVGNPQPMPMEEQQVWACMYGVQGTPYQAFAITPLTPPKAANILKHLK